LKFKLLKEIVWLLRFNYAAYLIQPYIILLTFVLPTAVILPGLLLYIQF